MSGVVRRWPLLRPVVVSSPMGAPRKKRPPRRPPESLNTNVFATDIARMNGFMRRSSCSVEGVICAIP